MCLEGIYEPGGTAGYYIDGNVVFKNDSTVILYKKPDQKFKCYYVVKKSSYRTYAHIKGGDCPKLVKQSGGVFRGMILARFQEGKMSVRHNEQCPELRRLGALFGANMD
ncbi:hypothetical protein FOL47_002243 [Perkinsus chesapeaki]|uniref:Uncharacterized protein n=1 Tax=Perkinsus chesapeaki TaxID=330153 RepID=A0A7J6N0E6_PERCH|nr:hypothetical protein FOL47_002243 [Perkinsus chesapeaki]